MSGDTTIHIASVERFANYTDSWVYSSGVDYYSNEKGLIEIDFLN